MANSTFSGNSALFGGGIWNYFATSFTIANSTFSGNSQTGSASYAAGITNYSGLITLNNCIVANSIGGPDLGGYWPFAGSNNLIGDGSDLGELASSVQGNPLLAPLGSYGGPTPTMALRSGSPAIAAGLPVAGILTDQRGLPRSSQPDIGAYQTQAAAS